MNDPAQTLSGTSNVVGDMFSDGTVSPAGTATVGGLNFSAALTLNASSTYEVDVAADGLTNDMLLVTGDLAGNGAINVSLNGFVPALGYMIDVADAASITGTPTVTGALPAGLAWDASGFATDGTLEVVMSTDPYGIWASANGLTPANDGSNMDPDMDTVSNLVEFVLGGQPNPANPNWNSTGLLPKVSTPGGDLVFTFTRDPQSQVPEIALTIEVGTDLMSFPDVYTVNIDNTSPDAEVTAVGNVITLTIPRSPNSKKFARLNAVYTP